MTRYTLRHVDISELASGRPYKSSASSRKKRINRIRAQHGPKLIEEYERAVKDAIKNRPQVPEGTTPPNEFVLEVELSERAGPAKLDRRTERTRQGATRKDASGGQRVTLFVPDGKKDVLPRLIRDYTYGDLKGPAGKQRPPNDARISEIEHIRRAEFETFWRDVPEEIPDDPRFQMWWALWCFRDRAEDVVATAKQLGCYVAERDKFLSFPDVEVVPIFARKVEIEILLFGTLGIAELRRATDSPTFFMEEVQGHERDWIADLAERVAWPSNKVPTVCLLDTGVNRAHPLLEPAVSEEAIDAVNQAWQPDDHHGHGTSLAGIALHGDLTAPLGDQSQRELKHRAESVKILPPPGFSPNEPQSYGPITQSAVAIAEIKNSQCPSRVYCMAVTNKNLTGAEATAWSAAIDLSAAGATVGDADGSSPRRLFVLAAGNIQDYEAISALHDPNAFPAQDPSQAWNALTVGGYTDRTEIHDSGYEDYSALAAPGELSPYSRNSCLWGEKKAPFKPDLVLEAGNRALNSKKTEAVAGLPSLSLLSTGSDVAQSPFEPFWATSAAAAQGARMAAQIAAEHPEYWPEMIRALIVHSAAWTNPMWSEIYAAKSKTSRGDLIRKFGYGVPRLEHALASATNHLAVVAQREIQPFLIDGGSVRFNEAHLFQLPWPAEVLQQLGETEVRLKVTLSYFVEPNPGYASAVDPMRYQSFGLRFDLKRPGETTTNFMKRRNLEDRASKDDKPGKSPDNKGWLLGERQISAGSLHCDVWTGSAVELAARNWLWVYPVNGWWRERRPLKRYNSKARYALVMTVETHDQSIDLYTPIVANVDTMIEINTGVGT